MLKRHSNTPPEWQQEGLQHIWMPYAQHLTMPQPISVVDADGCKVKLADGRELIDGIASWWTACHGYKHPNLVRAITEQAAQLPHFMFAGTNHEPALKLATKLAEITPKGLERVFFSDSGSTAVEVAMKMAVQYWYNKGKRLKQKFIAFHNGYHGDTMGCMSLCDPERGMHAGFTGYMPRQISIPIPSDEYAFSEFEQLLHDFEGQVAGLIIEPLLQGAGGMKFHTADVLAEVYRIAKQYDILFIADEVATGFGRTGYMFACDEAGVSPDILCLGKALTGGMMTMAATLATDEIFETFLSDDLYRAFMHGPTYMANPMACSAALASLKLFETEPRLEQVEALEQKMHDGLKPCLDLPHVLDVRVKGAIGVVQIDPSKVDIWWLRKRAVEEGIWIRPFADVIYLTPPFVISDDELNKLCKTIHGLVEEWHRLTA